MKLYLVQRTDDDRGYDEYDGFVIRAESEARVREMVLTGESDYSGRRPFSGFNDNNIKVVELNADGDEAIILSDFYAGS